MTEEKYEVIKSILAKNRWKVNLEKGILITSRGIARQLNTPGYYHVRTTFKGKEYNFGVHQIIAVAGGLNPVGKTINHKNGNKLDNRISNLEVMSLAENMKHAHKTELYKQTGEQSHFSKLTKSDVLKIRELLKKGESQSSIAKKFGVFQTAISKIKTGENWSEIS